MGVVRFLVILSYTGTDVEAIFPLRPALTPSR